MTSTHAVALAFRSSSVRVGKKFSPHSAKYYIGLLGLKRCKTVKELAAWSANMGHETIDITKRYYQKMHQSDIDDVFETFNQDPEPTMPNEDLILMLRYHEHQLVKGTPEFDCAKQLIAEHTANGTFK